MKLFDAHCHLQDDRLDPALDATFGRAATAGVRRFACCGSSESDWGAVRRLAAAHPEVIALYGLHPWFVGGRSPVWQETLASVLAEPGACVGEIGLDRAEPADFDVQESVFCAQLDIARDLDRPANIHCRKAWGPLLEILGGRGGHQPGFVVHSFSGAAELMPTLARLGGYFSFSGSITRERNARGRAALAAAPIERLLIETDAPDILPAMPGALTAPAGVTVWNEPANLVYVLEAAARVRGMPAEEMAETLWENSCRLYRLPA